MTDRATLLALADRVEAETGPSYALERSIAAAIGAKFARPFTASIDAALSLVPEGWAVVRWRIWPGIGGGSRLELWETHDAEGARWHTREDRKVEGKSPTTPALALTAAALRALAQEAPGDER